MVDMFVFTNLYTGKKIVSLFWITLAMLRDHSWRSSGTIGCQFNQGQ